MTYLALIWDSRAGAAADLLAQYGQHGLFLLPTEELIQQDDLIRRLIGQGHQVGLLLSGSDPAACLEQLEQGRQLIADIARSPLFIVSAPNLSGREQQILSGSGCVLWNSTQQAEELNRSTMLRKLSSERPNYLDVTCNDVGLAWLYSFLPVLTGEEFDLRQALPPLL